METKDRTCNASEKLLDLQGLMVRKLSALEARK